MAKVKKTGSDGTVKPRKTRSDKGSKKSANPNVDTTDLKAGQDNPRDMSVDGDAHIDPIDIEIVDGPDFRKRADALAFMEEKIEIMVHETTYKNAQPIVESWCNGRSQFFFRGQPTVVKRKYVGVLARAKQTTYTQQNVRLPNGDNTIRNIPHTALQYPFSVLQDPNPKGADWLRQTVAEA